MKRLRFKLEDILRGFVWYGNYFLFRLKNPILKKPPKSVKKILIIDLKFIGDLIIDTPLISSLKNYYNCEIHFLLPKSMKDLFNNNKNITKIYTSKEEIKDNFDIGILLYPGNKEYSNFLKQKAKFRIGIRRSGLTEPKGYYLHRKTKPSRLKHKVEDNLDVIKTLGIKKFNRKLELHTKEKTKYKDYIALTTKSKTHPTFSPEKFALLADKLIEKYKKQIIFTGPKEDINFIEKIRSLMKNKSLNLGGKTSLQEYFSIIKNAFLVVCIDTSASHVAAALNVPVVTIFSAGDKKIWKPYSNNSIAIQNNKVCTSCMKSNCSLKGKRYLECINSISIDYILSQAEYLLGSSTPAQ